MTARRKEVLSLDRVSMHRGLDCRKHHRIAQHWRWIFFGFVCKLDYRIFANSIHRNYFLGGSCSVTSIQWRKVFKGGNFWLLGGSRVEGNYMRSLNTGRSILFFFFLAYFEVRHKFWDQLYDFPWCLMGLKIQFNDLFEDFPPRLRSKMIRSLKIEYNFERQFWTIACTSNSTYFCSNITIKVTFWY